MVTLWILYGLYSLSFLLLAVLMVWFLHDRVARWFKAHPIHLTPKPSPHHVWTLPPFWDWHKLLLITALVLGTRMALFSLGLVSAWVDNQAVTWVTFQYQWNHWDTPHYLYLAEHGYNLVGDQRYLIVFFPLYPLVMKLVQLVVQDYFLAGLLVSNFSLIFACYLFYRLVYQDYGPHLAYQVVKFVLVSPLGIFLSVIYTESLFLALTLATFYCLRHRRWLLAALFGFLTALTRSFGVLLIIPAVWELGVSLWHQYGQTRKIQPVLLSGLLPGLSFLLIPLGVGIYLAMNQWLTGNWRTFLVYQEKHWFHTPIFFGTNLRNITQAALTSGPQASLLMWAPQMIILAGGIGLILWYWRHLRWSYVWYSVAYIIMIYSTSWQISGGRYLMALFPFYIVLALLARPRWLNDLVTFAFIILLGFYTTVFIKGYYLL